LAYNMSVRRIQAYKYELMPGGEQQHDMRRFAGSCRFVFNKGHRNNNLYQASVSITEYSFATWFISKMKDNCDQ
jgi:Helix-turn-helix domain